MKIRKTLYIKYCTSFLFYSQKSTPLKINSTCNTIPLIEIRKKPIYCIILNIVPLLGLLLALVDCGGCEDAFRGAVPRRTAAEAVHTNRL